MNELTKTARTVRWVIRIIATSLVILFGFLQTSYILKSIPFDAWIGNLNYDVLRRVTLFAYYLSWVFGVTYDTNVQEDVYDIEAAGAPLPVKAILLMLLFGAVAALLLWAARTDKLFSILLDVFFLFNISGSLYIRSYVTPIIRKSRQGYDSRRKYAEKIELSIVSDYTLGNWQWLRFLIGAIILTALNLVCFNLSIAIWISAEAVQWLPSLSTDRIFHLLPSLFLLIFVVVMEGWIWYKRIIVIVSLRAINNLDGGSLLSG